MSEDRPRFIERQAAAQTPEESRQRRALTMLGVGGVALLIGLLSTINGSAVGLLIGLLGVGLLVGGLVIRH
ncbi:hypothetical protein [Nocardioides sp.]|uniref:hypothetical protein n=1 Tax=Nocardioides sp. TaxID=35761 RepID=UPI0035685B04